MPPQESHLAYLEHLLVFVPLLLLAGVLAAVLEQLMMAAQQIVDVGQESWDPLAIEQFALKQVHRRGYDSIGFVHQVRHLVVLLLLQMRRWGWKTPYSVFHCNKRRRLECLECQGSGGVGFHEGRIALSRSWLPCGLSRFASV